MLESRDGTVWLASMQAGLLKIDREHKQIISYHNHPADNESLGSDDVISIFQDKEGNIWVCLQETEPYFFAERAQSVFKSFRLARQSGQSPCLFRKESTQRELLDVNEVVQEMIVLLRAEASRYSIAIDGDLAHEPPRITADRVQLQQVLMNLMLNGIEAIKGMGAPGKLTVKLLKQAENHQVLISVTDTGVGLPPEKVGQIFNAFFTTKPGGTGMGLAISSGSIIESHGGRLWATSNAGSGATFQFTLPSKVTAHDVA